MREATRYELVATAPDGRQFLAGYVRIPSKSSMVRMIRQNGQAWARLTGATRFALEGKGRMDWVMMLGAWEIRFSRRTKLEASRAPLPFFTKDAQD